MSNFIDIDSTYRDSLTYPNPAHYSISGEQVRSWPKSARTVSAQSNRPSNKVLEFSQGLLIKHFTLPYTQATYIDPVYTLYTLTVGPTTATTGASYTDPAGNFFFVVESVLNSTTILVKGTVPPSASPLTLQAGSGTSPIVYANAVASGNAIPFHTADLERIYLDIHSIHYNDSQLIYSTNFAKGNQLSQAKFTLFKDRIITDSTGAPIGVCFFCNMDQVTRFARDQPFVINIMQAQGYTIIIPDTNPPTPSQQVYILMDVTPYFRDANFTNSGIGLTQF